MVNDYRHAVSKGDDVAPFFKNLDKKNIRKDSYLRDEHENSINNNGNKYTVNVDKLSKGYDSVYVDGSSLNDDLDYQSIVVESENDHGMFSSSADESEGEHDELNFSATPHHSATNNNNKNNNNNNKLSRLSNVKQWITANSRQDDNYDNDDNTHQKQVQIETNEVSVQTHTKLTVDSGINTRTVLYNNVLHVSISAPGMLLKRFPQLCCSIAFGSKLKKLPLVDSKDFVGFLYSKKLEFEGKYAVQSSDIIEGVMRVGFHPNESEQMFAFCTSPLVELNIRIVDNGILLQDEEKKPAKTTDSIVSLMLDNKDISELAVKSTIDDKDNEMKFNQQCDLTTIRCQINQSVIPFSTDKCVETISLSEFVDDIIRAQRQAQLQRCRSACVETDKKPVYTESDLDMVRDDLASKLQALKCNYDEQIESLLLSAHSVTSGEEGVEGRDLVDMGTSPMLVMHDYGSMIDGSSFSMRASATTVANSTRSLSYNGVNDVTQSKGSPKVIPNGRSSTTTIKGESGGRGGSRRPLKFSQQWGKDLPSNFLTRVCQFQEASQQYHQQLKDRTTISVSRELTKKLKAEKKLSIHCSPKSRTSHQDRVDSDVVDVDSGISIGRDSSSNSSVYARDLYLPAVFMPFKVKRNNDSKTSGRSFLSNMNVYKSNESSTALQKLQLPFVLEKMNNKNRSEVGSGDR